MTNEIPLIGTAQAIVIRDLRAENEQLLRGLGLYEREIDTLRAESERLQAALEHIATMPECAHCKIAAWMDPRAVARQTLGHPKVGNV